MALRDTLRSVTVPIEGNTATSFWTGTGFFFKQEKKDDQGKIIDMQVWLVTNRHVALDKDETGKEIVPLSITFKMRCVDSTPKVQWFPITINEKELKTIMKVHNDANVDVALINVGQMIIDAQKANPQLKFTFSAMSDNDIPQYNGFDIDVCDDAIAIGYPRGYYDITNLFPIVKSGIIASPWGVAFMGLPRFLVDIKLFPGSSGSLVISKPSFDVVINGCQTTFTTKKYAFLGVFSSEPYKSGKPIKVDEELTIIKKSTYNLGIVWYSQLVIDIINSGVNP